MQFWCFLVRFSVHSALCCPPPVCPASPPLLPFSSAKRTESASPGLHPECFFKTRTGEQTPRVTNPFGVWPRHPSTRRYILSGPSVLANVPNQELASRPIYLSGYPHVLPPLPGPPPPAVFIHTRCILSTPRHFPTMFALLRHFPTSWALLLHFLLFAQIFLLCQRLCRFLCGHFSRSCCSIAGVVAVTLRPTCRAGSSLDSRLETRRLEANFPRLEGLETRRKDL